MAERGAIWLSTIAVLVALANAQFNVSEFELIKGSSNIKSNWPAEDTANTFKPFSAAGNDEKIWLVSRRYDVVHVKPGGIVSTLHLVNNTWTHRPHTLDMNNVNFKVLSLHGRLIMFVFAYSNGIKYGKLYSWNELEWTEIPFDPSVIENPVGLQIRLAVTVPDQSSNVAFLAASANDGRTTKAVVSKLEINFDANSQPINAKLSQIHRSTYSEPVSILVTPNNDGQLYVFWYGSVVKPGEIVDLKTGDRRPFEITPPSSNGLNINSDGTFDVMLGSNMLENPYFMVGNMDNCFQFRRDRLIIEGFGGFHMFLFDLNMHRLQVAFPRYDEASSMMFQGNTMVLDQKNGLMYAIDLDQGVFKGKINL